MKYFKFEIPKGLHYPPGWHGIMDKCPSDVEVLLYNDRDGYGIATTPESELPPGVEKLTDKEAKNLLAGVESRPDEGVYKGEAVRERLEWLPEAELKEEPVDDEEALASEPVTRTAQFCPACHTFIAWLPDNTQAKQVVLACPNGHKVVIRNGG